MKFVLLLIGISTQIEMEVYAGKKTCIESLYPAEPLSFNATVTEAPKNRFSIYLTIENKDKELVSHKKYDIEHKTTVLTFNNNKEQVLRICLDNFESFMVIADIQVKMDHQLGSTENLPDSSDYRELNKDLNKVLKDLKHSQSYFKQNQEESQDLVNKSNSYNLFLILASLITIGFTVGTGFFQVFMIKIDLKKKKEW